MKEVGVQAPNTNSLSDHYLVEIEQSYVVQVKFGQQVGHVFERETRQDFNYLAWQILAVACDGCKGQDWLRPSCLAA